MTVIHPIKIHFKGRDTISLINIFVADLKSIRDDIKSGQSDLSLNTLDKLFRAYNGAHPILNFDVQPMPAGTHDLVITAEPSDGFKMLAATIRALNGNGG